MLLASGFDIYNPAPLVLPEVVGIDGPGSVPFVEDADSPIIEFGEQCTITHSGTGSWADCLAQRVTRGTYFTDSYGNVTRVLTCRIAHLKDKPGCGRITVASEAISFAVPPDEFEYEPIEQNPALFKNTRYTSPASEYTAANPYGTLLVPRDIINIKAACEAPMEGTRSEALVTNPYTPGGDSPNAQLAALFQELYVKLNRGEENFYLAGLKIVWSSYAWFPQPMDLGGYIEDPTLVMPAQFFDGPQGLVIPAGMSFLRIADTQPYNRTWWKLQRTWLGMPPAGAWDPDVYAQQAQ